MLVGFKPENVPENLDAIIIGSGISGLTTAVVLGRVGQKVLVLEQHDQAGGCMHTFKDKGYEFDTGVYMNGSKRSKKKRDHEIKLCYIIIFIRKEQQVRGATFRLAVHNFFHTLKIICSFKESQHVLV